MLRCLYIADAMRYLFLIHLIEDIFYNFFASYLTTYSYINYITRTLFNDLRTAFVVKSQIKQEIKLYSVFRKASLFFAKYWTILFHYQDTYLISSEIHVFHNCKIDIHFK